MDRHRSLEQGPLPLLLCGAVGLLKSLTTRRFCGALLKHVNALVSVDHCALVRLTPGAGAQLFGAESAAAFVAKGARAVVRYIDRWHRIDPIRRALNADGRAETVVMRRERAVEVSDPGYRRECYEESDIVDRVSVASVDDSGGLVLLELQRQSTSGEFSDSERETIAAVAPLLAAACTRHVELLVHGGTGADAWRTRLAAACPQMTPRELDVAASLLAGRTLHECAAALGVARSSVVTYCERAYSRLGVRNLRELRMHFASGASREPVKKHSRARVPLVPGYASSRFNAQGVAP